MKCFIFPHDWVALSQLRGEQGFNQSRVNSSFLKTCRNATSTNIQGMNPIDNLHHNGYPSSVLEHIQESTPNVDMTYSLGI